MQEPTPIGVFVAPRPLRRLDACADTYRRVRFPRPRAAFTFQNEKHFFVVVEMIRRASRRNRTDKLRNLVAADLLIDEDAIPTIGGRLRALIREPNYRRPI